MPATPSFPSPLNLPRWLAENTHLLQPPVNNYCIQRGDFTVMILGGPNKRTDYHINMTDEWFYQHRGDMLLKVMEEDDSGVRTPRDVEIKEGDMFLLPGGVPHNPVRFVDTIGVVIERQRPEGVLDTLRWYCESCREIVYQESFYCVDLGVQLKPVIERFAGDAALRTCGKCGHVNSHK